MKFLKKIFHFFFGEPNYDFVDCVDCIHGTSTGNGICKECDGRYFEREKEKWVD